jgi:N-acetylneuraminate synthase
MNSSNPQIKIDNRIVNSSSQTYFIADIAANHDGDLERAKDLIYLSAEAGADAAKFQHFKAETIVSDKGFKSLGKQESHQASWKKSVYEVYDDASLNMDWTPILKETCDKAGISFFTSPYDLDIVDEVDKYLQAYKIGSGDITWIEIIEHIAKKNKPVIIASGASSFVDVERAVEKVLSINSQLALLQCNTNYTGSIENFKYINLNVLKTFKKSFPNIILGLSDHTPGHSTVLGAVSLGAKIIEKHFTDNNNLNGPDHSFSMDPKSWREMVERTRELELSLGNGVKEIELNELKTSVLQRRSIRIKRDMKQGEIINKDDLIMLRPCPEDSIAPFEVEKILGLKLKSDLDSGTAIKWKDLK